MAIAERKESFLTVSGRPVRPFYRCEEVDYREALGDPGEYPFTRGVYSTMYRARLWTMRQFAGYGTARDTNLRFKYLLDHGQTGLSVAFDMPTIMGYDSDHERAHGEVGRLGVAIDSLEDMEVMLDGIPLDQVTTSMTINGPAAVLLAMYVAVAKKQGVSPKAISGTIQNDMLKEYIAQKSFIFPPRPSMRIITDILAYCSREVPKWHAISISGYHIREAGSTAVQEMAFTLANGMAYVEAGIEAGLAVDDFAPRLSFFFNAHNDLFEEVSKYRAARRIWAKVMREKYRAQNPDSWKMRFHTQTAGCSLTSQQAENNIVRTAIQALAAVLGGTQSLHTNSMDEALALPGEQAVRIALRTQQVIAEESGVANAIDPLGGSYFVEALTSEMEEEAWEYFRRIEALGGVIPAIEKGFFQQEIAEAAFEHNRRVEQGILSVVGVNTYTTSEEVSIPILQVDPAVEKAQAERLKRMRRQRDSAVFCHSLERLRAAAREGTNLMPVILESVEAHASLGEIMGVLREEFGEYREQAIF
ncbi:MAG: methylmalonyl-CoA mutase family protein [Bacillota bacterium]